MTEQDELIDYLHSRARDQVHLAVIASAAPVAAMHIDLALFRQEQARAAQSCKPKRGPAHVIAA